MTTKLNSVELYAALVEKSVPIENHESTMYIPVNEETTTLIGQYESKSIVTTFVSPLDNKLWYDVPFAYQPFWEGKAKHVRS